MKRKNLLAIVLLLLVTNAVSYFLGSHEIYMAADCHKDGTTSIYYPHFYNTKESLYFERQYCNAWMELAHHYLYDNNPNIQDWMNEEDIERERNNYWYDVVMESDYYLKIDSLNEGYWEDWYCNWE